MARKSKKRLKELRIEITSVLPDDIVAHDAVPREFLPYHKQACRCILGLGKLLLERELLPSVQTYTNVYLMWHGCMRVIADARGCDHMDPRFGIVQHFRQMHINKLQVIIPAVCFWISIKCFETWMLSCLDVSCLISKLRYDLSLDDTSYACSLADIRKAEYAVLQLLDWNVIRNQDSVDRVEKVLMERFDASCDPKYVQMKTLVLMYRAFSVAHTCF
jgi:hypothetical protein